jgi:hypothetical protein
MQSHPTPMFQVIFVGPFTKWGIDFNTYHLVSTKGNSCISIVIEYFTKWVEAMPKINNDGEMTILFIFNQIVARFGILNFIVIDHGSYFQNKMMFELT